ncbi:MAG: hypothetical protein HWD92_11985 [Flavobacteriia bacterium]|nr:hypothetical protein [Flavobacteriia bacterium]
MSEAESEILDLFLASAVFVVMFIALIIVFVINYQRRLWRQNNKMRQMEADHQKSMLESAHAAMEVTQKRIATDLHDDIGASISTAKLYLKEIEGGEQVSEILTKTMTSLRRIVNDLMPPTLADFGLKPALQELVQQANQTDALKVELDWMATQKRYPEKVQLVVYRVAQELLNNSLKHSKASFIGFSVSQDGDILLMGFRDNGVGFVPSEVEMNVGLLNMRSRAEAVRGNFEYRSSPGSGFQARLEIPISEVKTASHGDH